MHSIYQEVLSAENYTYQHINTSVIDTAFRRPLWYAEDPMSSLVKEYFARSGETSVWHTTRAELWRFTTRRLSEGEIALGNKPEFFNDDDRTDLNTLEPLPDVTDNVIIHHTATHQISLRELNSLGLLRDVSVIRFLFFLDKLIDLLLFVDLILHELQELYFVDRSPLL